MAKDVANLTENFRRLEKTVNDGFNKIEILMETKYATKDEMTSVQERLDKYDNGYVWVNRVVWLIIISAILGLIIAPRVY